MSSLYVELYGEVIGNLVGEKEDFDFVANRDAVEKLGLGSTLLSLAIPLKLKDVQSKKARRQNFFKELLPEGANYELLINQISPGERNSFDILRRFGRDIAGAVQIYDESNKVPKEPFTRVVDDKTIRNLLENKNTFALGNDPEGGKTSLGGVQKKLVLARINNEWNQVMNGYPSTHILKPVSEKYATLIYDECFGMKLAKKLNLTSVDAQIQNFAGLNALVIERYDRDKRYKSDRIHQEDFNQILGASGNQKYQEYGGKVSLKTIAEAITKHMPKELSKMAKYVLFSYLIGDLDMHAKNLSVLHYSDGELKLAPRYDCVPMQHLPMDGKMALAINKKYYQAQINFGNIVKEISSWGVKDFAASEFVDQFEEAFLSTEPIKGQDGRILENIKMNIDVMRGSSNE